MANIEPSRAQYWLARSIRTCRELMSRDSHDRAAPVYLAVSLASIAKSLLHQNHAEQTHTQLREAHALFESARQTGQLTSLYRAQANEVAELLAKLDAEADPA